MARKITYNIYLTPEQIKLLEQLRERTRIAVSAHVRDAIDAYLNHIDAEGQHAEMGRPERAKG